jgi:hypothetical protein
MGKIIQTKFPPDNYYFDKGMKLLYCEPPNDPDIVIMYILNIYAGYDDLVKKIKSIIGERKFQGNPLSLAIINGCYYSICKKDVSNIDMDKDIMKVKSAIFQAWKIQNPGYDPTEFEEILF